jgi:hypothetical protein
MKTIIFLFTKAISTLMILLSGKNLIFSYGSVKCFE